MVLGDAGTSRHFYSFFEISATVRMIPREKKFSHLVRLTSLSQFARNCISNSLHEGYEYEELDSPLAYGVHVYRAFGIGGSREHDL